MKNTDKAFMMRPETKKEIIELLKKDENVIGALKSIYDQQTSEEQIHKGTLENNNVGFNSIDGNILSDIMNFYIRKGFLTEKQISFAKRSIKKYWKQLIIFGFSPQPNKSKKETDPKSKYLGIKKNADLKENNLIEIQFGFRKNDKKFFETVSEVKKLSGRKFNKKKGCWTAPLCYETVENLIDQDFKLNDQLDSWFKKQKSFQETELKAIEIPGLNKELYPFQNKGVSFIESRNGRALIGDEMGLGKSAQSIAWLQLRKELSPVIIIVPASIKLNWKKELNMWLEPGSYNLYLISGRPNPNEKYEQYKNHQVTQAKNGFKRDIIIINYDILSNITETKKVLNPNSGLLKKIKVEVKNSGWISFLLKIKPQVIIGDEIHYIKNNDTLRTKAFLKLCKKVPHVIGLSGTPIINRPIEFYNSIKVINPNIFPSYWSYAKKYCGASNNGWGWNYNGATNTEELHEIVTKHVMLRRKKSEVLKELPPKTRAVIPIELNNQKEYFRAKKNIINWILYNEGEEKAKKASNAEILVEFEKLKQLAVKGKMNSCIQWIKDFIDNDEKLVVFTTHKEIINELSEAFKNISVKLDGSTSLKNRQLAVDRFQSDDEIRLFLGNVKAAGVGITLTAASSTCFIELPWTVGETDQAEDRVHRIGQEAENVNAYYLLAEDTIEIEIAELLDEKRKVTSAVLDGVDVEDDSLLIKLLEKMVGKEKNNGRF